MLKPSYKLPMYVYSNIERCTKERFYTLCLSQGYLVKTLYYKLEVYDMALEKHL